MPKYRQYSRRYRCLVPHATSPSRTRRTASHRLALASTPLRLRRAVVVAARVRGPALSCRRIAPLPAALAPARPPSLRRRRSLRRYRSPSPPPPACASALACFRPRPTACPHRVASVAPAVVALAPPARPPDSATPSPPAFAARLSPQSAPFSPAYAGLYGVVKGTGAHVASAAAAASPDGGLWPCGLFRVGF